MQVFRVVPKPWMAESADGKYTWHLPTVRCGTCNSPIGANLGCPNLNISGKLDEELYKSRWPVSQTQFEQRKRPLQELLGKDKALFPGMGFGPFRGTVKHSEKRDFVWVWLQELLPKESTYELLSQRFQIATGPAIMEDCKTREIRSDYRRIVELKIVPCMAPQTLEFAESKQCPECGLRITKRPEKLFLKRKLIPEGIPLFIPEETGSIIASEYFAETVKRLKLSNIAFEPVVLV